MSQTPSIVNGRKAERMIELGSKEPADELQWRAVNQAAPEVLLAQSSDWAFMVRTGTMVPYAVRRTISHLMRFHKLYAEVTEGKVDSGWLEKVQEIDNIFPEINYRVYRSLQANFQPIPDILKPALAVFFHTDTSSPDSFFIVSA